MKFDTFASTLEEKRGLWDNMHARRKAGKPKRKPGDKNYPKTLNVEETCGKGEYFCNDEQKCKPIPEGHKVKDNGELVSEASAAWQRSAGKNKSGGLNEKGRKSYERENPGSDLKAPSKKKGNKRRASFCARMKGMKKKLTSAKTARDPDSRINKSLRAWNCEYEWELDLLEDAKMARQSDENLAAAHKKFSGMDQSSPANKFMLKRIEKEQKRRKKAVSEHHQKDKDGNTIPHEDDIKEAKVDNLIPDWKRSAARNKRYGNPHGSLALGGGIQRDRRDDHYNRRGKKTKGVKEEIANEAMILSKRSKGPDRSTPYRNRPEKGTVPPELVGKLKVGKDPRFKSKGVKEEIVNELKVPKGTSYEKMSYKKFKNTHKDFKSDGVPGKTLPRVTALDKKTGGTVSRPVKFVPESLRQAKINIGRDPDKKTCWDGYKAKGTKKKDGRDVPNCVKEDQVDEGMLVNVAKGVESGVKKFNKFDDRVTKAAKKKVGKVAKKVGMAAVRGTAGAVGGAVKGAFQGAKKGIKKGMREDLRSIYEGMYDIDPKTGESPVATATRKARKLSLSKDPKDQKKGREMDIATTKKLIGEKIKYDKSGSSMDYFLGPDPKKTKYYKDTVKKKTKKESVEYTGPNKEDRKQIKKLDNPTYAKKLADYEKNMDPKKRQALRDKATKGMKFTHEGTSYGITRGSGKPSGAMAAFGKKTEDPKKKFLKKHNCASKVKHEEYGVGECIKEMHTLDENGNISHYDVLFEKQLIKNVPVTELDILVSEMHEHYINDEKNQEVLEGSMKQARKNVGASTCWDGYKAKGTKKKNGRVVPNCEKEEKQWNEEYLDEVLGYAAKIAGGMVRDGVRGLSNPDIKPGKDTVKDLQNMSAQKKTGSKPVKKPGGAGGVKAEIDAKRKAAIEKQKQERRERATNILTADKAAKKKVKQSDTGQSLRDGEAGGAPNSSKPLKTEAVHQSQRPSNIRKKAKLNAALNRLQDLKVASKMKEEVELNERLGGKGVSKKAAAGSIYPGKKGDGDYPDSDRGAGNKATRRAGGKVKVKSPTFLAHIKNKAVKKTNEEVVTEIARKHPKLEENPYSMKNKLKMVGSSIKDRVKQKARALTTTHKEEVKNCGCGKDPCETYGEQKEKKRKNALQIQKYIGEKHDTPKNVKKIAKELDAAVKMHASQAKRLRKAGLSEEETKSTEDKQIETKKKRMNMIKKQILQKKLMAVRAGADGVAS